MGMTIIKSTTENTGGNCMVDVHVVTDGGNIKSIGVNEDGIVAYSIEEPFMYDGDVMDVVVWYDSNEAIWDRLPEIADDIIKASSQWPHYKFDRE